MSNQENSLASQLERLIQIQEARLKAEQERNALLFEQNRQLAKANALKVTEIQALALGVQLNQKSVGLESENWATTIYDKRLKHVIQEYSRENYPKHFEKPENNPVSEKE